MLGPTNGAAAWADAPPVSALGDDDDAERDGSHKDQQPKHVKEDQPNAGKGA
eukprot:gene7256-41833_t